MTFNIMLIAAKYRVFETYTVERAHPYVARKQTPTWFPLHEPELTLANDGHAQMVRITNICLN